MERDFMGLNSKDSSVKQEAVDGLKESVFSKRSAIHWSLSGNSQAGENQSPFSVQIVNDAKQAVPVSVSQSFYRAQFGGAPVKQNGVAVPSVGSFLAGTTEPWYNSKTSCAPAQLTIFYGGAVNVYNDISPEKAQAIMLLAGNGGGPATTPQTRVQAQAPVSITPAGDAVYVTQPFNLHPQPCSAISSPMSVSSHPIGRATNKDEGAKILKADTPRVINSLEAMKSAVPQARKASLARFLEKRKERAVASAPYNVTKDSIVSGEPSSMNAIAAAEN